MTNYEDFEKQYEAKILAKRAEFRDRLAEIAMTEVICGMLRPGMKILNSPEIADFAYLMADAMLRAREAK